MLTRLAAALATVALLAAPHAAAATIPDSPDGTVRAVAEGIASGHPEVLWQALPPSYQTDLNELTRLVADTVDPQLWDAAFATGRRAAAILAVKKDIILASSTLQQSGAVGDDLDSGWDAAVAVLDAVCSSEISTTAGLKTVDWERYLATTGADIVERARSAGGDDGNSPVDDLRRTRIEVVSVDGDHAVVRMTVPDEQPRDQELVRVEGRWVPKEMADGWDTRMAEARERLSNITDEERIEISTQGMMFVGMADGFLQQLEAVESPEEFDQMLAALIGPFLGGMQESMGEEMVVPE
jgi:hypothetical protein